MKAECGHISNATDAFAAVFRAQRIRRKPNELFSSRMPLMRWARNTEANE